MLSLDCSTVNGAAIHAVKKAKEKFWMSAMHFKCIEGQAFRHHETINLIICVVIAIVFLVRDSGAETFFD